jgi:hypothetical protein
MIRRECAEMVAESVANLMIPCSPSLGICQFARAGAFVSRHSLKKWYDERLTNLHVTTHRSQSKPVKSDLAYHKKPDPASRT